VAVAFSVAFYIWGFLGLVANGLNFMALEGNIGVGTLTHLVGGNLLWIGGMVLFGFGSLINSSRSQSRSNNRKSTTD
jgi:hypothetical protein